MAQGYRQGCYVQDQDPRYQAVIKGTSDGLEILLKAFADETKKEAILGGKALNRCFRIVSHWLHTQVLCPKTGAELNLHQSLRNVPKRGRTIILSEESWRRIALLAKVSKGMVDMNRVELIALRINRMTHEEVTYLYLCRCDDDWGIKGLRIMLAGDGTDKEKVKEMLSKYRK
ncbi:hypothetical protein H1164_17140 [Thermoactinomyces daqus]|uniref:DUF7680 domain-containing protein n=1 Tax=Thermoactinomyces daqus TaxID=1329516 RepID=A0A7W2AIS2_9BACL|nr:hypothetical protein [Thermoactinomyces daqus]MBA4544557.1 hypothetical protein [Thermoactinomyces daqus]